MRVGNLVEFSYNCGTKALGIVTWEKGDRFKAIWSDGNPYSEMSTPLSKSSCITGTWEVIDWRKESNKEEINMKNSNDALQVGDLINWSVLSGEKSLGYVIELTAKKFKAVFSDEVAESWFNIENIDWLSRENIVDHWKVVTYTQEPSSKVIKGNDGLGTTKVTSHEDKLSVVAEHMNNAYMAIQGILQAHADKNGEEVEPLKDKSPQEFYKDGWNDCLESIHSLEEEQFTFADFDKSVNRTWKKQSFKDAVSNASLGLTGEAGEVADLIKKAIYHGRNFKEFSKDGKIHHTPLQGDLSGCIDPEDVIDELSDVLFYLSAMAQEFGFTLEDVAKHNKAKLEKRYEKGFTVEESAQKKDKHVPIMFRKPYEEEN
ncbi:hypothetical protein PSYJYH_000014 [Bacillus phage PSYJ-YH]|nr:hypothetical protein PSYJYH_000014 [Bacillus phage PSYJ-YH]